MLLKFETKVFITMLLELRRESLLLSTSILEATVRHLQSKMSRTHHEEVVAIAPHPKAPQETADPLREPV